MTETWIQRVRSGDIRATARLITRIERRDPEAVQVVKDLYSECGRTHLVGVTGPPGVGKSCLVSALVSRIRKADRTVGVLAVDPSSPITGGALLGDRARMIELSGDKGVFIRSLASRGASGGLSAAVNDAADILDVSGKDIVIIETVGVGQADVGIAGLAHTVLLVLMPGYGDTLQAMKAGLTEVADVFVVNKSDKPGADETVAELLTVREFQWSHGEKDRWVPPILQTSATAGTGIEVLVGTVRDHFEYLKQHSLLFQENKDRRTKQFLDILTQQIRDEFLAELSSDPVLQRWVEKIGALELDPYSASEQVIQLIKDAREHKRAPEAT